MGSCGEPFDPRAFPSDLRERQQQLDTLKLTGRVYRVDWLADTISTLDLSGSEIRSLRGLPSSVTWLNVSNTSISNLRGLPQGLLTLDLRWTEVQDLRGLPRSIRHLAVGGSHLSGLEGLPEGLLSLTIDRIQQSRLPPLPATLQSLTIAGPVLTGLGPLPDSLRSLSLTGTSLELLSGLPASLERLELIRNPNLRTVELPLHLQILNADFLSIPVDFSGGLPKNLRELHLSRGTISGPLPPSLLALSLNQASVRQLSGVPEGLRILKTDSLAPFVGLPCFPEPTPGACPLQALDLSGSELPDLGPLLTKDSGSVDLDRLPRSLKRLNLSGLPISELTGLPASLEFLGISATDLVELNDLPQGLKTLVFRWAKVTKLERLPPTLEELDLSGSPNLPTEFSLPEHLQSLRTLNLSQTTVTRLRALPRSLQTLDISSTQLQSLRALSPELLGLTLHLGQVSDLKSLPDTTTGLLYTEKF